MMRLMLIFLLAVMVTAAQEATAPDVTGLTVPEAAAELNRAGFRFGTETAVEWTADAPVPANTISEQRVNGMTVDVTVLRSPNARLIYDDNDITLVNDSGGNLSLGGLVFSSGSASFNAIRWRPGIPAGDCVQLWSVGRTSGKDLPECGSVFWLTTNNPAEHFWTQGGRFNVVQDGVQRATCPPAPNVCAFFLAGADAAEVTEYVYLAYTPDRFLMRNPSETGWMILDGVQLFGQGLPEGGTPLIPDVSVFDSADFVGELGRLAPGQCHYYTNNADGAALLEDCDEIARASVNIAAPIWWNSEFRLQGPRTGRESSCPGALEGRLTVCIVPR